VLQFIPVAEGCDMHMMENEDVRKEERKEGKVFSFTNTHNFDISIASDQIS
jgi:hypothetical protein